MTDDERRGFDPAGYNSELTAIRSGPVEVVRYHNRAHVEISRPLNAGQAVRIFETVAAIVRNDIRNDESRNALIWYLKTANPGALQIDKAIAQIYQDGMSIKALEALVEAADLMRIIIEKSKGVWRCDFAEDGEHCPWSDFESVTHFLQALSAARERQGEE